MKDGQMKAQLRHLVRAVTLPIAKKAAASYVSGPEVADALAIATRIQNRGIASSICPWDGPEDSPENISCSYETAVAMLKNNPLDCYVSVKAPSLRYDRNLFVRLMSTADSRVRIHFDALDPASADPTFSLVESLLPKFPNLTVTLPGRWRRSLQDAEWAAQKGIGVRVVKGQWADPEYDNRDLNAAFLAVIEKLAGKASFVAVATHDPSLARAALTELQSAKTPCELELLFGLPVSGALSVARSLGVKPRLYIPYGHAWLPYSLGKTIQNPRILWWTLRDVLFARRDETYTSKPSRKVQLYQMELPRQ